ncbi:hypothetical protein C8R43DRAFT_965636 [Mycena crocata]|nr:hypothetical protein C8R43DRAFT_965636 [Mycena crocata]
MRRAIAATGIRGQLKAGVSNVDTSDVEDLQGREGVGEPHRRYSGGRRLIATRSKDQDHPADRTLTMMEAQTKPRECPNQSIRAQIGRILVATGVIFDLQARLNPDAFYVDGKGNRTEINMKQWQHWLDYPCHDCGGTWKVQTPVQQEEANDAESLGCKNKGFERGGEGVGNVQNNDRSKVGRQKEGHAGKAQVRIHSRVQCEGRRSVKKLRETGGRHDVPLIVEVNMQTLQIGESQKIGKCVHSWAISITIQYRVLNTERTSNPELHQGGATTNDSCQFGGSVTMSYGEAHNVKPAEGRQRNLLERYRGGAKVKLLQSGMIPPKPASGNGRVINGKEIVAPGGRPEVQVVAAVMGIHEIQNDMEGDGARTLQERASGFQGHPVTYTDRGPKQGVGDDDAKPRRANATKERAKCIKASVVEVVDDFLAQHKGENKRVKKEAAGLQRLIYEKDKQRGFEKEFARPLDEHQTNSGGGQGIAAVAKKAGPFTIENQVKRRSINDQTTTVSRLSAREDTRRYPRLRYAAGRKRSEAAPGQNLTSVSVIAAELITRGRLQDAKRLELIIGRLGQMACKP